MRSFSGLNNRTVDNNLTPHEEIKNAYKENNTGKYKTYNNIFLFLKTFFLFDLIQNFIGKQLYICVLGHKNIQIDNL